MASLLVADALAADASAFYEAEIAVASKGEDARDDNLRRAFTQLLNRTVAPEAMDTKAVGAMLRRPADFVEEFEYLPAKDKAGSEVIRVRFDVEAFREALQRAAIPEWGPERPQVVVWLWVQDASGRRLINLQESPEFQAPLAAASSTRGLGLITPLVDLTDQANLTAADFDSGNVARMREATWRYDSDFAVVGLLQQQAGAPTWHAGWRFVGPAGAGYWHVGPVELVAASTSGIDGAYERMVGLFGASAGRRSEFDIEVEGIASMQDADRCGSYLRGLPTVKRADWLKAESNVAAWRLTIAGQPESFRQMLAVTRSLRPSALHDTKRQPYLYRWIP